MTYQNETLTVWIGNASENDPQNVCCIFQAQKKQEKVTKTDTQEQPAKQEAITKNNFFPTIPVLVPASIESEKQLQKHNFPTIPVRSPASYLV